MLEAKQVRQVFGARIRAARLAHGITGATLAEQVGVSGAAVSYWETGENEPGTIQKPRIAAALGVDVATLFSLDGIESEAVA